MSRILNSILGSYDSETARIVLTEGAYYHLPNNTSDYKEADDTLTLGALVFEHELTHWFQDVGTPLGMAFHWFNTSAASKIRTICNVISQQYPADKIQLPLYPPTRIMADNLYLADVISITASYYTMWEVLDGKRVLEISEAAWLFAGLLYDTGNENFTYKYWTNMSEIAKKHAREPSSPFSRSGETIGAMVLQEGQARAIEEMRIIAAIEYNEPINDNIKVLDSEKWAGYYCHALDFMCEILNLGSLQEMTRGDLFYVLYLFSAICDLAMATPISPRFVKCWDEKYSWKDFHPGWRFQRLCYALLYLDIGLEYHNVDSYNNFACELTALLNWRSPVEMYSRAALPNCGFSIIEELAIRFSNVRTKYPYIMISPFLSNGQHDTNNDFFSELLLAVPPPYIGFMRKDEFKPKSLELVFPLDPPLKVKGIEIFDTRQLEYVIKTEKYWADLAFNMVWNGTKPKYVPEGLANSDTVRLITGLPEDRFHWKEEEN